MATKPTERILDWASGGSTTDPGAGKEATGWEVDDRPPANWWNWILNSFGKWLSYLETWTDENESIQAVVRTGVTPSIVYQNGGISGTTDSGSNLLLDLSVTFAASSQMVIVVSTESAGYTLGANAIDTTTVSLSAELDDGTTVNLTSTTLDIHVLIFGARA